mgnify:CR=1 FL=1
MGADCTRPRVSLAAAPPVDETDDDTTDEDEGEHEDAHGALSRAADVAALAAWSATKHGGGMEPLWTPQEVDRAAA